jgi:hypothetical protein
LRRDDRLPLEQGPKLASDERLSIPPKFVDDMRGKLPDRHAFHRIRHIHLQFPASYVIRKL